MHTMKRLLLGVGLVALSAGAAAAAPAVVESGVNLRSGPGTGYAVIDTMPAGARVDVTSCTGGWCHVAYNGEEGYASRSYLDLQAATVAPGYEYYGPAYGYYGYDQPYYAYGYDYGYPAVGFGWYGGRWHPHHHDDHDHGWAHQGGDHGRFGRTNTSGVVGNRAFGQGHANIGAARVPSGSHIGSVGMGARPGSIGTVGAGARMSGAGTVGAGGPAPGAALEGGRIGGGAPGGGGHVGGGRR